MTHNSFGLVLSGGGARGLSHVGVLKSLLNMGYIPSCIVGVSMGALVGATYALNDNWYSELKSIDTSGFPSIPDFNVPGIAARLKNLLKAERSLQDMYFGWGSRQRTVDWANGVLASLTCGKQLQQGRVPIYISSTDMLSGKRVITSTGNAADAVYASSALAGILPPFDDGEHLLIDGAYSDIAPVDVVRKLGIECVIAVDPSQHETQKRPENGIQAMLRAFEICQNEHADMRLRKANLVLRPTFSRTIATLDFQYRRDCIAAGAHTVRKSALEIRQLLCAGAKT